MVRLALPAGLAVAGYLLMSADPARADDRPAGSLLSTVTNTVKDAGSDLLTVTNTVENAGDAAVTERPVAAPLGQRGGSARTSASPLEARHDKPGRPARHGHSARSAHRAEAGGSTPRGTASRDVAAVRPRPDQKPSTVTKRGGRAKGGTAPAPIVTPGHVTAPEPVVAVRAPSRLVKTLLPAPGCAPQVTCESLGTVVTTVGVAADRLPAPAVVTTVDVAADRLLAPAVATTVDVAADRLLAPAVATTVDVAADRLLVPVAGAVSRVPLPVTGVLDPLPAPVTGTIGSVLSPAPSGPGLVAPVIAPRAPLPPTGPVGPAPEPAAVATPGRLIGLAAATGGTPAAAPDPPPPAGPAPRLNARTPCQGRSPGRLRAAGHDSAGARHGTTPAPGPWPTSYIGLVAPCVSAGTHAASGTWATTPGGWLPAQPRGGIPTADSEHRFGRRLTSAPPPG